MPPSINRTVVVVLALGLGAAGCGAPSAAEQRGDQLGRQAAAVRAADEQVPDCDDHACDVEITAFTDALEQLPDVVRVADVAYSPVSFNDSAHVVGDVWVTRSAARDDCETMGLPVAQLLWESSISPLGGADLHCYGPGDGPDNRYAYLSPNLNTFTVDQLTLWGQRGQRGQ